MGTPFVFWKRFLWLFFLIVLLVTQASATLAGDDTNDPDDLTFTLTPYLWLPSIGGNLNLPVPAGSTGAPSSSINMDADDLLDDLEMVFVMEMELRKERWFFAADFIYMDISDSAGKVKSIDFGGSRVKTTLDIGTDMELKSFVTTFGGGYQIVDREWLQMGIFLGARYLWMEADVNWNLSATVTGPLASHTFARTGSLKESGDVWNGVGGVRGRFRLGDSHWFIPFYGDIGTGDSDLTWQVFAGISYSFGSWDIDLGWRYLEFDSGSDDFIEELDMSGPILGARIRF